MSVVASIALLLVGINMLELHNAAGDPVFINPFQITSLRQPSKFHAYHFAKGTQCLVFVSNSNMVGVRETCQQVSDHLLSIGPSYKPGEPY